MVQASEKGAVSAVLAECACVMGAAVAGDQLGCDRARSCRSPAGQTHWRFSELRVTQVYI